MGRLTKRQIDAAEPSEAERFLWDADVRGFGVRVKTTGSKSFVLKYRVGRATKRFTIGKVGSPYTVEQARERASSLLLGLKEGIDPAQAKAEDRQAVTVAELVDLYLQDGPALKPNKKASSWATDRSVATRHIKPLLGRKLARAVTSEDVGKFQADVAAGKTAKEEKTGPRGLARVTGGRRVAALSTAVLGAAFQFGIDTRRVADNPARGVPLLKTDKRERFLSIREVAAIGEALSRMEEDGSINPTMADAARLLMLSGTRRDEVLGLQWSWVDLEKSCLRLPTEGSKTGQKVVPLGAPAVEILARRRAARPRAAKAADGAALQFSPYVFPGARGESHSTGLAKKWAEVKARAEAVAMEEVERGEAAEGISLSGTRLHDLRHSFASFAIARGSALYLVGKVLGHRQSRTTESYAHLADDPLRTVAENTSGEIAAAMRPRRPGEVVKLPLRL